MSKLSWGKCRIKLADLTSEGTPGTYTERPIPKQDSTSLSTTAGDEIEAYEEGGDVVDVRYGAAKYELTWQEFVKKGETDTFADKEHNGRIDGEHAAQVIPEDDDCEGIQIDRCVLRREGTVTAADGKLYTYYAKGLKPTTGNIVKPWHKTS